MAEKAFEELDVGSHDEGRIPIFGSVLFLLGNGVWLLVIRFMPTGQAVVLKNRLLPEDASEYLRVLLDNAGVGNDVDDALELVPCRVVKRKYC